MVGRVLTGNGITRYGDGLYTLIGAEELSGTERDELLQLCRQRLDGFREQRGEESARSSPGTSSAAAFSQTCKTPLG
jgi:hypothetical protein